MTSCISAVYDYKNTVTALPLDLVEVTAAIKGVHVETRLRIVVRNPTDAALEAELVVPLPDGVAVCEFATQATDPISNTETLVWASLVQKDVGRIAFEAEVRAGNKAALVEQVGQSNMFKTRLYPIPAKGTYAAELIYIDTLVCHPLLSQPTDAAAILHRQHSGKNTFALLDDSQLQAIVALGSAHLQILPVPANAL